MDASRPAYNSDIGPFFLARLVPQRGTIPKGAAAARYRRPATVSVALTGCPLRV